MHGEFSNTANLGSSKYITVAGIIVHQSCADHFGQKHKQIVETYFTRRGISLPDGFKLHYTALKRRHLKKPYRFLHFEERCELSHNIFQTILDIDCKLIACTIDKESYRRRYGKDAKNPKAYALLVCIERFKRFLAQAGRDDGTEFMIIYEEFNRIRKMMKISFDELLALLEFPNPKNLQGVEQSIHSGRPNLYPVLQFADFVAHVVWFHKTKPNQLRDRFTDLERKFYNMADPMAKSGYVEI